MSAVSLESLIAATVSLLKNPKSKTPEPHCFPSRSRHRRGFAKSLQSDRYCRLNIILLHARLIILETTRFVIKEDRRSVDRSTIRPSVIYRNTDVLAGAELGYATFLLSNSLTAASAHCRPAVARREAAS